MEANVYLPFTMWTDVFLLTLSPAYLTEDNSDCILVMLFVVNSHAPNQNKPSAVLKHLCSLC